MSMSGINILDETIKRYDEMRFRKQAGGLVLKITEDAIEIESEELDANFQNIVAELPEAEPRFVLYDIPLKNRANLEVVKTVFVFWMPMESPVRLRMKYASSKTLITRNFRGIVTQLQMDEKQELLIDNIIEKVNKTQGINNQAN